MSGGRIPSVLARVLPKRCPVAQHCATCSAVRRNRAGAPSVEQRKAGDSGTPLPAWPEPVAVSIASSTTIDPDPRSVKTKATVVRDVPEPVASVRTSSQTSLRGLAYSGFVGALWGFRQAKRQIKLLRAVRDVTQRYPSSPDISPSSPSTTAAVQLLRVPLPARSDNSDSPVPDVRPVLPRRLRRRNELTYSRNGSMV